MNDKIFTNDPLTDFMLGVDDDRTEDMSLEEVLDRVIREKVKGEDTPLNEVEEKVAKAKKKLAGSIARLDAYASDGANPFMPLFLLSFLNGKMMTNGFRGAFTDKAGNPIPEDVYENELLPLAKKNTNYKMLIDAIEELTEDNSCGVMVPPIVGNIFVLKDELLEFLNERKKNNEAEMQKIFGRGFKKGE